MVFVKSNWNKLFFLINRKLPGNKSLVDWWLAKLMWLQTYTAKTRPAEQICQWTPIMYMYYTAANICIIVVQTKELFILQHVSLRQWELRPHLSDLLFLRTHFRGSRGIKIKIEERQTKNCMKMPKNEKNYLFLKSYF